MVKYSEPRYLIGNEERAGMGGYIRSERRKKEHEEGLERILKEITKGYEIRNEQSQCYEMNYWGKNQEPGALEELIIEATKNKRKKSFLKKIRKKRIIRKKNKTINYKEIGDQTYEEIIKEVLGSHGGNANDGIWLSYRMSRRKKKIMISYVMSGRSGGQGGGKMKTRNYGTEIVWVLRIKKKK